MQNQKKGGGASLREKGYAGGDPLSNVYSRGLENQADRVGLEYMVAAGYDPRQAPEVWKQVAKAGEQKVYWKGQDDVASRRSYLLSEIRNTYPGVDFQSYVRDREEFVVLAERFGNTSIVRNAPGAPAETSTAARPGFQERRPVVPSSPQQAYGSNALTITSDPEGADVVLNGRVIGKTPLILPTGSVLQRTPSCTSIHPSPNLHHRSATKLLTLLPPHPWLARVGSLQRAVRPAYRSWAWLE